VLVTGRATLDPANGNLISRAPIIAHVKYDQYGVPKFVHPADVNSDGVVDAADTAFWKQAWNEYVNGASGQTPPKEIWKGVADADENGLVDTGADPNNQNLPSATNTDWVAFQAQYAAATAPGAIPLDQQLGNLPLYAGYWWDDAIGLYHVRHRVYRPEWGRWLQRDPLGYAPGWNLYQYVNGMPWGSVDPMGLDGADLRSRWREEEALRRIEEGKPGYDADPNDPGEVFYYRIHQGFAGAVLFAAAYPIVQGLSAIHWTIAGAVALAEFGMAAKGGEVTGTAIYEVVAGEDASTGESLTPAELAARAADATVGTVSIAVMATSTLLGKGPISTDAKGRLGELTSSRFYKVNGFTQLKSKLKSNHGIDHVFVRKNADGTVDVVIIHESKYQTGGGKPGMGQSKSGKQMSDKWVEAKVREMERSGDSELQAAAAAIRAAKSRGRLQKKASVLDENGNYRMYDVDRNGNTSPCNP
jgi:RHS repeat-associated protein